MTTKEMIAILQAYEQNKTIQVKTNGVWTDIIGEPQWHFDHCDYRIKPEPKRRPYANAEEFLQAQKEHGPYFQILGGRTLFQPSIIGVDYVTFTIDLELYPEFGKFNFRTQCEKYISMLDNFTWQDGTPCGIIKEEQPC